MNTETQQTGKDQEKAKNEMNFGNHLMNYITHQLAIIPDEENRKSIARIRTMSYEQLKKFEVKITPVPDEHFVIKGFRIERVLKS